MKLTILKTNLSSEQVLNSLDQDPFQSLVSTNPMTFLVKGSRMTLRDVIPYVESGSRLAIECSDRTYVFVSTMLAPDESRIFVATGTGQRKEVEKREEQLEKDIARIKK